MQIDSMLPSQSFSFALPKNYRDSVYTVRLLYPEYVPLTKKEIRQYKKLTGNAEAPSTPVMEYVYAKERTNNYLNANFTPIVKQSGKYYYVSSFKPTLYSAKANTADALDVVGRPLQEWPMLRANDFDKGISIDIDGLRVVVIVAVNLFGCFYERLGRVLLILRTLGAAVSLDMITSTNTEFPVLWADDGHKVLCRLIIDF